jgi:hypothetical protein
MVDLDAVREVSHARTRWRVVRMSDDDYTVAAIDQFLILSALQVRTDTPHYQSGTLKQSRTDDNW